MIQPSTEIRLCKNIPFANDYEHVIRFSTEADQTAYFLSKAEYTFDEFTYQREEQAIKVPYGYDYLYECNYAMYRNPQYANRWFYAFITKREYVNPNTTRIYIQTDVYQTWQFRTRWKPCYIIREHTDRYEANGDPVVNTIDEGLDYGTEYDTVQVQQFLPHDDVLFLVMVCQKRMDVNSKEITPVLNGSPQPLTYYAHPFKMDGSVPAISIDGTGQTLSSIKDVLKALYTSSTAVNNVSAVYITESIGQRDLNFPMANFEPVNIQDAAGTNFVTLYVKNLPEYEVKTTDIGLKYAGFDWPNETKLLMYPYCVTVLTDLKGNYQEIKNEYINSDHIFITTKGSIGVSNKVCYQIDNYNQLDTIDNAYESAQTTGIINNNPNDVPIITDLLSAYLQGNRNQIENQKNSIVFNGMMNALSGVVGGIGQAASGNIGGAVNTAAGTIQGTGNTLFQLQANQSKQQDINNMPPQLSKMGGNTAFDFGNGIRGLYIIKKQIKPQYRQQLESYFKMYGYKVNELKVPNFKQRKEYNFIQMASVNVWGEIPHDDLNEIKAIFKQGVTIWHTDDVGNYDLPNNEV
jgi:Caudoviral major tail protein N-terminus